MSDSIAIASASGPMVEILCASALRSALSECASEFAKIGGAAAFRFDTSGGVNKRGRDGEACDLFASSLDFIEDLAARGIASPAVIRVGSSRIALGVRTQTAAPDISTQGKFCDALLAAKAIAIGDPAGGGTAGTYLQGVIAGLGLTEALASKLILRVGGFNVMREVAEGNADFGLTQSTEIGAVEGVRIGAWLTDELQLTTQYALAPKAGKPTRAACRFTDFLAEPRIREIFDRAGFARP